MMISITTIIMIIIAIIITQITIMTLITIIPKTTIIALEIMTNNNSSSNQ